jgi:FlgO protein
MKMKVIILLTLLLPLLNACTPYSQRPIKDVDLVEVSYDAVDTLLNQTSQPIPKGSLVVVSTLVNVDDLNQTSAFGRIVSDQIASAFNNAGYLIKGMELPTANFVKSEGGFLHLTKETKQTLTKLNVSALVAGVFAAGRNSAYVSLRVVDISSMNVISSTDFSVPMGPDARVLLKSRKTGDAIPK